MSIRHRFTREEDYIPERSSFLLETKLTDASGTTLIPAQLDSLTLTWFDDMTTAQAIVNGLNQANILNAGRGTMDAQTGLLTIAFLPDDTPILNAVNRIERRVAQLRYTWGASGEHANYQEFEVFIKNLSKVP